MFRSMDKVKHQQAIQQHPQPAPGLRLVRQRAQQAVPGHKQRYVRSPSSTLERNQNTTTEDLRSTAPHDSEEETNYEMNYVNNIVMVQMKVSLHEGSDEEGSQSWRRDPLCQWYSNKEKPVPSVRTVTQEPSRKPRNIEVILDSGADVSLASNWMKKYGKKIQGKSAQLGATTRRKKTIRCCTGTPSH